MCYRPLKFIPFMAVETQPGIRWKFQLPRIVRLVGVMAESTQADGYRLMFKFLIGLDAVALRAQFTAFEPDFELVAAQIRRPVADDAVAAVRRDGMDVLLFCLVRMAGGGNAGFPRVECDFFSGCNRLRGKNRKQ